MANSSMDTVSSQDSTLELLVSSRVHATSPNTVTTVALCHNKLKTSCGQNCDLRNKRDRWKGWRIGSYLHARLPEDAPGDASYHQQTSECRPVLLVDIEDVKQGAAKLVVPPLYDHKPAIQIPAGLRAAAWWTALMTSLSWPRRSTSRLSDSSETASSWDHKALWHAVPTSVATNRTISARICRPQSHHTSPRDDLHAASRTGPSFHFFLRLPSELRDMIYSYTLLDEHQMTDKSRIYTGALLFRESCRKDGLHQRYYPRVLTNESLPMLHTPCILLSSKQIRQESLSNLSRTKTLVISVTPATGFPDFGVTRLPHASIFMHIRLELILGDLAADTMIGILGRAADFLLQCAQMLQYLEVRIGYQRTTASAAIVDHGIALVMTPEDIRRGMRELGRFTSERRPLRVSWGISEAQRRLNDYNCTCIYLSARCLTYLWSRVFDEERTTMDAGLAIEEEGCHTLGCRFHQC